MKHFAPLFLALAFTPSLVLAQKADGQAERSGNWFLPVSMKVTAEGAKAKDITVQIYKDNVKLNEFHPEKGKVNIDLDLDNTYTLILSKEGYRSKSVYLDTHLPAGVKTYPAYECAMELEAMHKFTYSDPYYLDFPSAIVRYDEKAGGFMPNGEYLTDIQSKIAMLQAQMTPE